MARVYQGPQPILLCIDENHGILACGRSPFERSGFIVVTATSAQEGLRLVTMYSFDAVLIDYHMPDMNGHHLASAIRRIRPGTPVVMFSSSEVPVETSWSMLSYPKSRAIRTIANCYSTVKGHRQPDQPVRSDFCL
jgi:CheY-like chemotaxis protein